MQFSAIFPLSLSRRQWRELALLLGLMLASAFTEGFGLLLLVPMLDVLGNDQGSANPVTQALYSLGVPLTLGGLLTLFVALVLLRAVVNFARRIQGQKFEASLVDGLRDRAWRALLHSDWRYLSTLREADNASLVISNIDRIGFGVHEALNACAIMVTLVGVGLAAFAISSPLAIAAALIAALVLVAYKRVRRRARLVGEEVSHAYTDVHGHMSEGLGALRVIKSFGNEEVTAQRGASAFARLRRAQIAFIRDAGLAQAALQVGGALLLALLVWIAIARWGAGPSQILPLVALFARALPLIAGLQQSWQQWAHSLPAIIATNTLIDSAEAHAEPKPDGSAHAPSLESELVLHNVSVRFEGRDRTALDSIDLRLPARSVTAITGPSGAGKSTLADVIGGLVAPDRGTFSVDGVPITGPMQRAWRERVTYVQQEPILFTGTIRENLAWVAPDDGEEAYEGVLSQAAAGFVFDLPEGLDTPIGQGGRQLSGGERQRLVLARALLRDPTLLILDEASSALDRENEQLIAGAVEQLRSRITIVIIGHHGELSSIADHRIVLENGRVAEHLAP